VKHPQVHLYLIDSLKFTYLFMCRTMWY